MNAALQDAVVTLDRHAHYLADGLQLGWPGMVGQMSPVYVAVRRSDIEALTDLCGVPRTDPPGLAAARRERGLTDRQEIQEHVNRYMEVVEPWQ